MTSEREERLRQSWEINADAWTSAVRGRRIPSRNAGTDRAILSTLEALPKGELLDVGCGEGWLSREAVHQGWSVVGVDGSAALIERAREMPGAEYLVMNYRHMARHSEFLRRFDAIVCNFSILGEDVNELLAGFRDLLKPAGSLVIQTVHPCPACGDRPYRDGWREETFEGWPDNFTAVMPWFFRTLASWFHELKVAKLGVTGLIEPVDPDTTRPLSIILLCKPLPSED